MDIIANTPIFKGLPENQLQEIRQIAVEKHFSKRSTIFLQGDEGNGFYIVADGKVKIFKISSEGKEQILHIFGAGEPFGEVPVFSGQSFPANAEAIAKSRLLFFPRAAFAKLITDNPSLALNMLAVLSMRLREFAARIESLSLKEVPARLAGYLIVLAEEQGTPDAVELNISKGQLASILGTVPETLSRIFAKMTDQGLIEVNGPNIRLLNRAEMDEVAGKE
ncbi:MAG: Crp/Fnr family transcriptional regulator [Desulfobacteraceae bacterium]|nr:Crp/Fnr family transcriptional regulator [Desulfobacteraceae bacterium]